MLYFLVFYSLVTFMPFRNIFPLHLFKKYSKGIIFYWKGLEQGTRRGGRRWLPFFFFFHSNLLAPKEAFFLYLGRLGALGSLFIRGQGSIFRGHDFVNPTKIQDLRNQVLYYFLL